jgi:hypothetical protein
MAAYHFLRRPNTTWQPLQPTTKDSTTQRSHAFLAYRHQLTVRTLKSQ